MKLSRREILAGATMAMLPLPALAAKSATLQPAEMALKIGEKTSDMLGFNAVIPGPMLRVKQNETLEVRLENGLEDGTLVHWHGIRVPNRMDGVNVLTQDAIPPGTAFNYRFAPPDAGTYWYHSHYLSVEQVSLGLFGPLIVDEMSPPDIDHDIVAMTFDFLLGANGVFDREFYVAHYATSGRIGNFQTVFLSQETAEKGARLRLRLINPSTDRVYEIRIGGVEGAIVALDGMPLRRPVVLGDVSLAPGQRVDVIADVTGDVTVTNVAESSSQLLGKILMSGERQRRNSPISPLPYHGLPQPGVVSTTVELVLQGGAGSAAHGGFGTWALNDGSGLPRWPLVSVRAGETVKIRLKNDTAFPHGMHLHGHHFWETSADGTTTVLRDTTLVLAGETRDILCVLDNPGAWLLHCHMLSHSADGMATWVQVT